MGKNSQLPKKKEKCVWMNDRTQKNVYVNAYVSCAPNGVKVHIKKDPAIDLFMLIIES